MEQFYFSLSDAELQLLPTLPRYEKALLSSVVHTLRLGVYIFQRKTETSKHFDATIPGAEQCNKYIISSLRSHVQSDKKFPLRHTGPSMQYILQNLPPPSHSTARLTSIGIFQLCIWRAFAFGNYEYLEKSKLDRTKPLDLHLLGSTIHQWGQGEKKLTVPAYGQLQIVKAKIPDMLSLFWEFSREIFAAVHESEKLLTFADIHSRLIAKNIPSIPRYGLIGWLLISDFFEYGICEQPMINDLAEHIMHSGASGPKNGLNLVADMNGEPAPANSEELAKALGRVFELLQSPPRDIPIIGKTAGDCEAVQGRKLAVVDLEHALCKIARQDSRARVRKGKGGAKKGDIQKDGSGNPIQPNRRGGGEDEVDDDDESEEDEGVRPTRMRKKVQMANVEHWVLNQQQ